MYELNFNLFLFFALPHANARRYLTDRDLIIFSLENGKSLIMELTPTINDMLRLLIQNGLSFTKGSEVTRKMPYREGIQ